MVVLLCADQTCDTHVAGLDVVREAGSFGLVDDLVALADDHVGAVPCVSGCGHVGKRPVGESAADTARLVDRKSTRLNSSHWS